MDWKQYKGSSYWQQLYIDFQYELSRHIKEINDVVARSELCVSVSISCLAKLKDAIKEYSFTDRDEEIFFFKYVKPRFHHYFIFYNKVLNIERRLVLASATRQEDYLRRELLKVDLFFETHSSLYEYYRTGETDRDTRYFTRQRELSAKDVDDTAADSDALFSTPKEYQWSSLLANEKLVPYISNRIASIQTNTGPIPTNEIPYLKWEKKRVQLGELLYAFYADNVFGIREIKSLANAISLLFGCDLGNPYKLFEEIRLRKKESLPYLHHLIKITEEQMDIDNNRAR